jgi:two-component system sensor histidine kinase UhpB
MDASPAWAWAMLGAAYGLAWLALMHQSHVLWFLPAGLRLAGLWLSPVRRWPWLMAGEWLALAGFHAGLGIDLATLSYVGTNVLPTLVYAACVLVLRGPQPVGGPDSPRAMITLLGTGLLCALLVSPLLSFLVPVPGQDPASLAGALMYLYGDFVGQLVLVPLLAWLATGLSRGQRLRAMAPELLVLMVVVLGIFWLLQGRPALAPYLLMLMFTPLFLLGFRQGWPGATVGVSLTGLAIELFRQLQLLPAELTLLQVVLAVVGGAALLQGASVSALRRGHETLAQRHQQLAGMNDELATLAAELRDVSQRLVRLQEHGQRELATALEYELGQAINALGTRISLGFRESRDPQPLRLLESLREQVRDCQDSLRQALRQLRPAILDSQGLREALAQGPLRELTEDAGAGFESQCLGQPEALDDDARTALYRICQSAVRDGTRRASLRRVAIRLEATPVASGQLDVSLQVDVELSPDPRGGGLQALDDIRDRTLALRGSYETEILAQGLRHRVRFACVPVAAPAAG